MAAIAQSMKHPNNTMPGVVPVTKLPQFPDTYGQQQAVMAVLKGYSTSFYERRPNVDISHDECLPKLAKLARMAAEPLQKQKTYCFI